MDTESFVSKVVSFSQYKMWATCPLAWKLAYIDKLAPDGRNIHHIFGSAMHDVIQFWLDVLYNQSRLKAATIDLDDLLKTRMIHHFKDTTQEENGVKVFVCDQQTLMDFYADGTAILHDLQTKSKEYFPTEEWGLEGVEIPLRVPLIGTDVFFVGYCDIILRHKLTGAIKIIDLKTSTKGWGQWKKADKLTTDQVVLYKHYYARQFNVAEDSIEVEFLILKRKLWEDSPYPQKRIVAFQPAAGSISLTRATSAFTTFVNECFDQEGAFQTHEFKATPSKSSCMFCPFNAQPDLCAVAWKE